MVPPTSGPPIMASAITPAIMPWYLPRSRGGIRSPMIAMTPTIRPPAPSPCTARKPISCPMSWAMPLRRGADQEDHDRGEEDALAAVHVAELAPDRGGGGGGERVGGDDPGEVLQAAELADDGRHRGARRSCCRAWRAASRSSARGRHDPTLRGCVPASARPPTGLTVVRHVSGSLRFRTHTSVATRSHLLAARLVHYTGEGRTRN